MHVRQVVNKTSARGRNVSHLGRAHIEENGNLLILENCRPHRLRIKKSRTERKQRILRRDKLSPEFIK
jgi:hypothetical protein